MKVNQVKLAKLVSKEERVLAFQFNDIGQLEVLTAIDLGIAEIVNGHFGGEIIEPHLFIKTNVDKKGRSTWKNIHKKDCVIISYRLDTEGGVVVQDAKKISFSQLVNKYTDDDTPDLFDNQKSRKNKNNNIVRIADEHRNGEITKVHNNKRA